jgi:hypothetical protein
MDDEDDVAGPVEIELPVSTFRLGVFCVEVHLKGPFSLRLFYDRILAEEC